MSQKITEKEVAQSLLDSAYVLITQPEADITGQEVESLRRVPLSVLLKKCGGNGDGEVDPEVVKQIVDEYLAENPPSGFTDQEIADAVEDYLKDNPITGGGLSITDDGNGNVTVESTGSVTITDDGEGNVTIA